MQVKSATIVAVMICSMASYAEEPSLPKAFIDGTGHGWRQLTLDDFENVNCHANTWTQKEGVIHCTGQPVGVTRTKKPFSNLELVVEWRHLESAGNSGIFFWAPIAALKDLKPDVLPEFGIEVQVLDHGYKEQFEKSTGQKADWFTTHGDVFPLDSSKMQPFPPSAAEGSRSFPRKHFSKGLNEWNHYYVRAINGELRLWVNGEEVSGGSECEPREGYLCLESEGGPVEFRNLRVRELP